MILLVEPCVVQIDGGNHCDVWSVVSFNGAAGLFDFSNVFLVDQTVLSLGDTTEVNHDTGWLYTVLLRLINAQ